MAATPDEIKKFKGRKSLEVQNFGDPVSSLESKLLSMTSHSYDAIDKEMKRISKEQNITPKQLHDQFKSKHNGKIPDEWIKDQTSTDNSEMDDQQFMCDDGKCGKCPMCQKKKQMMAIGYSEEAVDAVVADMMACYAEKGLKGSYRKGLTEGEQSTAKREAKETMAKAKSGAGTKSVYEDWDSDKSYNKRQKKSGKKMPESESTKAYKRQFGDSNDNSELDDQEFNEALRKKAKQSGMSYGTLKKVYDRGMAAWRSGHRPGVAPQQWAMGRVNSFITGKGGARKADADLLGGGKSKGGKGKRQGKNRKS